MLCVMGMTRLVLDLDLAVNLHMNGGALISRAFLLLTCSPTRWTSAPTSL